MPSVPVTHCKVDRLAVGDCVAMRSGVAGVVSSIERWATQQRMVCVRSRVGSDVWFGEDESGLVPLAEMRNDSK